MEEMRFTYQHPIIEDNENGGHLIPRDLVVIANGLELQINELRKEKEKLIEWLKQTQDFRDDVLIRTVLQKLA